MAAPLLTTKLYIPPARPDSVPRPRLIERMNEGLLGQSGFARKLTLVSAPAGFGKTTLLSDWTRQCPFPVAWVSLDSGDSDPARFWAYVIAALQTIHEGIGASALAGLQSPQPPPMDGLLTGLLNEIAQVADPFALVLDDLHTVSDQRVTDALAFLVDNLPPRMHLFLSSRADPPWPLARLRARREMAELRTRDLRFTSQEVASFLNQVMELALSPQDVATLEARTEGWIVGLQMASLAMQGRLSTRGQQDASGFIQAFDGSHRFVLDYLVEEVLDQQPPRIQAFLLQTSILERLTAPLCNAVAGTEEGQAILTQLEQANLFLVPLDEGRRWYRYHQLFADLLRNRLALAQPGHVPALHRRASEWYESQDQIVEAMGHALAAGDVEWIERLVAGNTLALVYHGELATVTRWLDALPDEVKRARPRLRVAHAWALAHAGQLDRTEPLLRKAERALALPDETAKAPILSEAERLRLSGHVAGIRAYVAALGGDDARAAELARQALDRLPEEDLAVRGWTALVLGCALRSQGEFPAAAQAFAEAIAISRAAGDDHLAVDALWEQAVYQLGQGQLRKVMSTCQEALRIAKQYTSRGGRQLPVTGSTYALMANVLCEWNDVEASLRYARQGIELCQQWGQADALTQGYFFLARALRVAGDFDGALDAIQKARQVAGALGPWYPTIAGAHEVRIRLAQGDLAAAARWLQDSELSIDGELSIDYSLGYLTQARILLAQGQLDETLELLVRLFRVAKEAGAIAAIIAISILQALVLQAQGEGDRALATLERALSLAEPGGYVRTFIDQGPPMGELLRKAAARGIRSGYVRQLLAALESEPGYARQTSRLASLSLVESLTGREMEVLGLLATHLPATEIAQELVISVNTVRSHIKSIYGKLDVHSRREAVARAQDLGLL
jgi:LuxR family maltose regulon positive regulatory protein